MSCLSTHIAERNDKGVFLHENHKKVDLNKVCAFMVEAHIDCAPVLTRVARWPGTKDAKFFLKRCQKLPNRFFLIMTS